MKANKHRQCKWVKIAIAAVKADCFHKRKIIIRSRGEWLAETSASHYSLYIFVFEMRQRFVASLLPAMLVLKVFSHCPTFQRRKRRFPMRQHAATHGNWFRLHCQRKTRCTLKQKLERDFHFDSMSQKREACAIELPDPLCSYLGRVKTLSRLTSIRTFRFGLLPPTKDSTVMNPTNIKINQSRCCNRAEMNYKQNAAAPQIEMAEEKKIIHRCSILDEHSSEGSVYKQRYIIQVDR